MRRMLDPKEAGGSLPSTIKFDAEGNRTVGKDVKVDGKLKLKSLVSDTNPDGDITKELGGTKLYNHSIQLYGELASVNFNYYSSQSKAFSVSTLTAAIGKKIITVSGTISSTDSSLKLAQYITADRGILEVAYIKYPRTDNMIHIQTLTTTNINDKPLPVE